MSVQTVTLELPEAIYSHLQQAADMMQRPLEDVVAQTIRGNLPPAANSFPPDVQAELALLQKADDQTLWRIAQEPLPTIQWQRHEDLLEKNQADALSTTEKAELERLRHRTDRLVLRRSYALALLKWRGYAFPPTSTMPS